jgi:hypothetical protein
VSTCTIDTLLQTVSENAGEGAAVEKDEFIEMVRILPSLRSGEAFRPIEETLERIYRSFEAANRVDLYLVSRMRLRFLLSVACVLIDLMRFYLSGDAM